MMRRIFKGLGIALLGLALAVGVIAVVFPPDGVDREIAFDPATLPENLEAWLDEREAAVPALRPESGKQIVWAAAPGTKTPLAVVYIHGFSADREEIRPVPDDVAAALGANLFLTRLAGHGRDGAAMAEPTAGDWIEDVAEAMAIGRRLGDRVILIGTSTGGTLAALAATDPALSHGLAGVVLVSPNFKVRNPAAFLLDLPLAPTWAPWIAGREAGFTPINDGHAAHWTTQYPSAAFFPMAALLREAGRTDYSAAKVPLLVLSNPADQVIDPAAIAPVMAAWGAKVTAVELTPGPNDDPYGHVLAGRILSPGLTDAGVETILNWTQGL
ncbi:MAG: alpha/beta hydrolase [Rhodobacteraceae bacterium PARR1]|nr:MAG: alpha/beta hydrolase [Rhodobacteraceae bacterium PARR1]